ncbi:peroxisomal membrane protein PEX14 [Aspergillus stella-maris]|uniref:peroxisomal membrane protein PEX14 n=1 Tax=Aspergillus stella-maris TaxID=1810926 RepID=UPI003CCD1B79
MSDPDSKPSIPSWQQQHSASSPSTSDSGDASDSADRSTLVEQASKFLQDDAIRDASTDRKIVFLESKGLTSTEIDGLLGVSRNPEASSNGNSSSIAEESKETSTDSTHGSNSTTSPATPPESAQTNVTSTAPRDVPPIITYPEFLLHQSKPPPLVTLRSVLYTLYGAAGLGATIYGASEYLVKPMLATLTDARLDLAQTTEENLRKLNEKLEANVSQIPPSLLASNKHATSTADDASEVEDTDSYTSDPTELFHRDIGTQTTPDLNNPPTPSFSTPQTEEDPSKQDPSYIPTTHTTRLTSIASSLRSLEESATQSTTLHDTTRSRIADLQRYLDSLLYSKNSYPYTATTGYGVYPTPGIDSGSSAATGVGRAEEDAISGFRAEIRGVKGALLSARNFPSGRGGGLRGSYVR